MWQCKLVLTDRELVRLVWREPITRMREWLQERVALLHTVLGMTGEEASRVVGGAEMYLTGGRQQLLTWVVEFYGSQEGARAVVLKGPQLAEQNLETCQRNVAALRRQLAQANPLLMEGELAASVLDIDSR